MSAARKAVVAAAKKYPVGATIRCDAWGVCFVVPAEFDAKYAQSSRYTLEGAALAAPDRFRTGCGGPYITVLTKQGKLTNIRADDPSVEFLDKPEEAAEPTSIVQNFYQTVVVTA